MYFPVWIILVVISMWVSLMAFVWGVFSGQFADQDRARYLPFIAEKGNLSEPPPSKSRILNGFYLALLAAGAVFFALAAGMGIYYQLAG